MAFGLSWFAVLVWKFGLFLLDLLWVGFIVHWWGFDSCWIVDRVRVTDFWFCFRLVLCGLFVYCVCVLAFGCACMICLFTFCWFRRVGLLCYALLVCFCCFGLRLCFVVFAVFMVCVLAGLFLRL